MIRFSAQGPYLLLVSLGRALIRDKALIRDGALISVFRNSQMFKAKLASSRLSEVGDEPKTSEKKNQGGLRRGAGAAALLSFLHRLSPPSFFLSLSLFFSFLSQLPRAWNRLKSSSKLVFIQIWFCDILSFCVTRRLHDGRRELPCWLKRDLSQGI